MAAPDKVDEDGDGQAQPEWTKLMGEELMIQVRMNVDTKGAYCTVVSGRKGTSFVFVFFVRRCGAVRCCAVRDE